jgi:hypothetical protein
VQGGPDFFNRIGRERSPDMPASISEPVKYHPERQQDDKQQNKDEGPAVPRVQGRCLRVGSESPQQRASLRSNSMTEAA